LSESRIFWSSFSRRTMGKKKRNLTPEELDRVRQLIDEARRDLRRVIELLESKLGGKAA